MDASCASACGCAQCDQRNDEHDSVGTDMEKEKHDDQASETGTSEISEVYFMNVIGSGDKAYADTQGAEKKRDKD